MKKRIIVCGYPKSGNTWLTRLTAEIVGCPVVGFWCEPFNSEQAIEGLDRHSEYHCFKAHHNADQLSHTLAYYGSGSEKIIYVVRDPRDVIVSASHYFPAKRRQRPKANPETSVPGDKLSDSAEPASRDTQRIALFADKLLDGGKRSGTRWLRTPWKKHVQGFLDRGAFVARYEDLGEDPLGEARRLCQHLNIDRSDRQLLDAIERQSFESKKRALLREGKPIKAKLLREGTSGQWQAILDRETVERVNSRLGDLLTTLGYSDQPPGS